MSVVSIENAEHYRWGDASEGWHLLKSDELSVIEERVPPGDSDARHYHRVAQQFFYVLAGEATLEVAGDIHNLSSGQGLAVPATVPHQLSNQSTDVLRFLVVSQPMSHGDRVGA